jgi:hypothetical protein
MLEYTRNLLGSRGVLAMNISTRCTNLVRNWLLSCAFETDFGRISNISIYSMFIQETCSASMFSLKLLFRYYSWDFLMLLLRTWKWIKLNAVQPPNLASNKMGEPCKFNCIGIRVRSLWTIWQMQHILVYTVRYSSMPYKNYLLWRQMKIFIEQVQTHLELGNSCFGPNELHLYMDKYFSKKVTREYIVHQFVEYIYSGPLVQSVKLH